MMQDGAHPARGGRIGVLGGSFDPVHRAHVAIAKLAWRIFDLDRVLFVPARIPPHKLGGTLTDGFHRYAMVALALASEKDLVPCAVELQRREVSYTIDTLEAVRRGSRGRCFLIMGQDALGDLPAWKDYRKLLRMATVVAFRRGDEAAREALAGLGRPITAVDARKASSWPHADQKGVFLVRWRGMHVSATAVRESVAEGRSIKGLVSGSVETYIRRCGLYRAPRERI